MRKSGNRTASYRNVVASGRNHTTTSNNICSSEGGEGLNNPVVKELRFPMLSCMLTSVRDLHSKGPGSLLCLLSVCPFSGAPVPRLTPFFLVCATNHLCH